MVSLTSPQVIPDLEYVRNRVEGLVGDARVQCLPQSGPGVSPLFLSTSTNLEGTG